VSGLLELVAGWQDWPWWTLALAATLLLRALLVLALGPSGAAWRGLVALVAGLVTVAQLALEGPRAALLPLHAVAAVVVMLLPWERPHPEPPPLMLGRNRKRRARAPLARALLALATVAAAIVWTFIAPQ
jgi:hypothetical protein